MQDIQSPTAMTLENQLTERFGLLLSQTQLAQLLGRSTGGLRYSLSYPSDRQTRALKACGRKIGRRVYYPAAEVAQIILEPSGNEAPSDRETGAPAERLRSIFKYSLYRYTGLRIQVPWARSPLSTQGILPAGTCGVSPCVSFIERPVQDVPPWPLGQAVLHIGPCISIPRSDPHVSKEV